MPHIRSNPLFAAAFLTLGLAGCATPPANPEDRAEFERLNDPIEPTNRVLYKVNTAIDENVLEPVARGYRYVTPQGVRTGVHNVLTNAGTPVTLGNDMLQGKPRRAGDTLMRFAINTTAGVLGIFDVADGMGYPRHDADFGQTLALHGVGEGPFLYLPVLGPSNPRDAGGFVADTVADPFTWVGQGAIVTAATAGKSAIGAVDARERLLDPIAQIKRTALDPYATFRSLYRQRRAADIDQVRSDTRATVPAWYN